MKISDMTPDDWAMSLSRELDNVAPHLETLNLRYEGKPPIAFLHPAVAEELGERLQQVIINWPRLVTGSLEERLDVTGFRVPGDDSTGTLSKELWRIWKANSMVAGSQQAHVDAMVMGRSFIVVGSNPQDASTPVMTVESPRQMVASHDPATRKIRAAFKRYVDRDPITGSIMAQYGALYLPKITCWYQRLGNGTWSMSQQDEHGLERPPVAELLNQPRIMNPMGTSEFTDIIPLADAASKAATDMMISAEFHAMPRRYALGFSEDDFTDEDGNPLNRWQQIAGAVWSTERTTRDDGVQVGQFPEAQLSNFHATINLLAQLVGSVSGLPAHYMGQATDNPPSADSIRSNEARLVKRAERRCGSYGEGHEDAQRIGQRIITGRWDPALRGLETIWRNPATPTYAQMADAVVKLVSAGILPTEMAWEQLEYSPEQIARMKAMQDDAVTRVTEADLRALTTSPGAATGSPEPARTVQ